MEPVEINAGAYYMRQLRADNRLDDRPALIAAFADPELRRWVNGYRIDDEDDATRYVERRALEWEQDLRCSWAVAEPTTGELIGEIGLYHLNLATGSAEAACWVVPGWRGRGAAAEALAAALRFGRGALSLRHVEYRHDERNTASRRVAEKCGFVRHGFRDGLVVWQLPAEKLLPVTD